MRFVVVATDDRAAAALVRMGYLSAGGGRFATRWFPRAAEPERHFARFTASIGPMVRQKAGLDPVLWEDALLAFVRRVEGAGIHLWLYGPARRSARRRRDRSRATVSARGNSAVRSCSVR